MVRALLFSIVVMLVGCVGAARPIAAEPEAAALSSAALDTLEREACPQLLARTFPLDDPRSHLSSGRLWVRKCDAKRVAGALALDVDVLGWQWAGEASWGFEVREYVYFSAVISARLNAQIEATPEGAVSLRVWTDKPPEVHVRAIGRVDAKAKTPAASLLGAASALAGRGPNALATSALRSGVEALIADRASAGIPIAIGQAAPVRGTKTKALPLLDEQQSLHPGGALISGSFAPGLTTTLRWEMKSPGAALARPVCVEEALDLVDAVVDLRKPPAAHTPHDVVTMEGSGEASLPALPCRWVLVTGTRDDLALTVGVRLASRPPRVVAHPTRRWVRATLIAYDVNAAAPVRTGATDDQREKLAVTFAVGAEGPNASVGTRTAAAPRLASFGRALATAESSVVGQVAPLFEVALASPIAIEARAQRPRPPSLFNATPGFEDTPIARGTLAVPTIGPVTIDLFQDGKKVGWARLELTLLEVE